MVEADCDLDLPRFVFRGVRGFAGVVLFETVIQVIGQSDIRLTRMRETAEEIDVFHAIEYLKERVCEVSLCGDHRPYFAENGCAVLAT